MGVEHDLANLVSRWRDQSGKNRHVVQGDGSRQPAWRRVGINGQPALHFDGSDYLLRSNGMPTGDYTKVMVCSLETYLANNNVLSGAASHAVFFGFSDRAQIYHDGTFVTSSIATPLDQATLLVATYDAATGVGQLYQDGVFAGSGIKGPNTSASIQVGAFAGGNCFTGSIAEVMVYDHVLSSLERREVDGYLQARYRRGSCPRVTLAAAPGDGQVLQRDASDLATVAITGTVHTGGYSALLLETLRDGVAWKSVARPLTYDAAGAAPFTIADTIDAGLVHYDLRLSLVANDERVLVAASDNLVCGDCYLLNGQSNTVAADYHGEHLGNQSQSEWIRSFGSAVVAADVAFDRNWNEADGESLYAHGSVGAWGLRMAALLVQQYQVPVGLINGAVGGTSITQHQRNDLDPADLTTIYGRLLYRASAAGLSTTARAMLWYQGESDGEESDRYQLDWQTLHGSWALDYPALERIYVFQIRKGCGVTFAGVREVLRQLEDRYQDVTVMSTDAAPTHDGCHYYYAGYRELGDRIARVVARDLYGSTDTQNIDPPNIATARFGSPAHDQIVLTFRDADDTLVWDAGTEAYVLLDDGVAATSAQVSGNTVTLQLASPSTTTHVALDGHPFDGPWLKNARGVGALSFFGVPVLP
ncbi:MAG: sialate O-acetylesterase [Planctomycetota bacterium]